MAAIEKVSSKYQSVPSVRKLAAALDRQKAKNAELTKGPGLAGVMIPTQLAAAGGGYLDAKMPNMFGGRLQPSAAAAVGLAVFGAMKGNAACIYASSTLFGVQAYAAGARFAGYDVAIIETASDTEAA